MIPIRDFHFLLVVKVSATTDLYRWRTRRVGSHTDVQCDYSSINLNLVFLQGGHGDALAPSLADAAFLNRTKPRGSDPIVMGDFNIDLLPTLAIDPWSAVSGREEKHRCEGNSSTPLWRPLVLPYILPTDRLACQVALSVRQPPSA